MSDHRLIITRFDATSTADDVVAGVDLSGVHAVVTGGSKGIGLETARALVSAGAEVTLAVRDLTDGARAAEDISRTTGRDRVRVARLDLASRDTIETLAREWDGPLHLLVNNAAVVPDGLQRSAEGWELQFATNHLGHFRLALGLRDALVSGADERGEARIVALSSTAHMKSPVVFDDIHFERRAYDQQLAYAQSKTANALFAVEATRRWAAHGVFANAVNPGAVATDIHRNLTPQHKAFLAAARESGALVYKTPQQGAATTLVAAVAPEFAHTGGRYLHHGNEAHTVADDGHPDGDGVRQWALDEESARRLWSVSLDLIGVADTDPN